MPTIQETIEGLECLVTNQHRCAGCPFNPRPGMEWVYGCGKGQKDIVDAAKERLEMDAAMEDDLK